MADQHPSVRTATIRTDHGTTMRTKQVARAVRPDNTDSMRTVVENTTVRTDIRRETTGGLQSTVDDYIVNLGVATAVLDSIAEDTDATGTEGTDHQTQQTTDTTQ